MRERRENVTHEKLQLGDTHTLAIRALVSPSASHDASNPDGKKDWLVDFSCAVACATLCSRNEVGEYGAKVPHPMISGPRMACSSERVSISL